MPKKSKVKVVTPGQARKHNMSPLEYQRSLEAKGFSVTFKLK